MLNIHNVTELDSVRGEAIGWLEDIGFPMDAIFGDIDVINAVDFNYEGGWKAFLKEA